MEGGNIQIVCPQGDIGGLQTGILGNPAKLVLCNSGSQRSREISGNNILLAGTSRTGSNYPSSPGRGRTSVLIIRVPSQKAIGEVLVNSEFKSLEQVHSIQEVLHGYDFFQ